METNQESYYSNLRKALEEYYPLSENPWNSFRKILKFREVKKGGFLIIDGQTARNIHFVCKGIFRAYHMDRNGNEYNKIFFPENTFAASKVSLLLSEPSYFTIEALEDSSVLDINFRLYKKLMEEFQEIKNIYINYIEKNWIVEKEKREIALVMQNATERYLTFIERFPSLEKRIPQFHIASHLGVTPTQLSRIRKDLDLRNK